MTSSAARWSRRGRRHTRRLVASLALVTVGTAVVAGGCGGGAPAPPDVSEAWAVPVDDGAAAAVYMTITGTASDELVDVSVARSVAPRVDVVNPDDASEDGPGHLGHLDPGGSLGGNHPHTIPVSKDRPVELQPDGAYLALSPLVEPLAPGDTFPLTLSFRESGDVTVDVTVRAADPP